jgi:hypothetical protein
MKVHIFDQYHNDLLSQQDTDWLELEMSSILLPVSKNATIDKTLFFEI